MIQRLMLYPVVMALLIAALFLSKQWYKDTQLIRDYATEVSDYLSGQALDAAAWASSHPELALPNASTTLRNDLEEQNDQAYTVLVYTGDSLTSWSNNRVIPLRKPQKQPTGSWQLLYLPGGIYAANELPLTAETWVLVPLRYAGQSDTDAALFPANKAIPPTVQLSATGSGQPVVADGQALCYLNASGTVQPAWVQAMRAVFWGLFLVVFMMFLYRLADAARRRWSFSASIAVVVLPILTLTAWSSATGYMEGAFPSIDWLSQRFDPAFLGLRSVGDLLQFVFLMILGLGYALGRSPEELPKLPKSVWAIFSMGSLALGVVASVLLWQKCNQNPWIIVNTDTILRTNGPGLAVLLGGMLLQMAFVMLGLVFWRYRMDDIRRAPGLGWLLIGLLAQAFFNSFLLYNGYRSTENERRKEYATQLAEERDTSAEMALSQLAQTLQNDKEVERLLKPWPFKPKREGMEAYLRQRIYQEPYLFEHYRLGTYAFDSQAPLFQEQVETAPQIVQPFWENATQTPSANGVRHALGPNMAFQYTIKLQPNRMGDPTQPADLFLTFQREYPVPNRVYTRLFYQTPYKKLMTLAEYNFAVHRNQRVNVEYGQVDATIWQPMPEAGQVRLTEHDAYAVARSASGQTLSAVGSVGRGMVQAVYLFAILFSLSTLLVLVLVLLNRFLLIAPEGGLVSLNTKGSLARRIHLGSIGLIGGAFVVIGLLTYNHFTHAAEQNARSGQNARADAVLNSLRRSLGDERALAADSIHSEANQILDDLADGLSLDVQVYDQVGRLLVTTQPELTQVGVLPTRMSPWALCALSAGASSQLSVNEQTAGRKVEMRYLSLRNLRNELLGFIGVPFDAGKQRVGQEVSDFIGILAVLFVSLLLIAFVATLLIAQSIIRPLKLISEKITQLRLDNQNQPLEYAGNSQDELSDLIDEYNRMVGKLEDSKLRLIRLEREGAWREMARQVAHDIKNPLTTMKLSMQQLERVSNNPEQAAAYLKKAITRLIEQIDSLAQIASEFSMFANLDIQKKTDMVINHVVESVYDLFSEQKDVDFKLNVPYERFHINGDKNHLIRVFNNLIINAIQAIPSDRKGQIKVSLSRKNNIAVVQISDNGGGIPPEIRDRVFEPNFTTKTSGSGLGLAICRKIVEALDGHIRFETRDNDGTDFFVEFPITFEEPAEQIPAVQNV
jgi:signal transduction histidine kinase